MELCDFQKIDPSNNLVYPWLTHPALKVIENWNLDGLNVLEFGGGLSTIWWAAKAGHVMTIETDPVWCDKIRMIATEKGLLDKITLFQRPCNEGDQSKIEYYTDIPKWYDPDIIVVDGILRNECLTKGIQLLSSSRGGYIIADNVYQDFVWLSPASLNIMSPYNPTFHIQSDHVNHEGNPWKTAIFYVCKNIPKDWHPENDYSSHRPMLWMALNNIKGLVLEFGCGYGSTPLLDEYCSPGSGHVFQSYETDERWAERFDNVLVIDDYRAMPWLEESDDCDPAILFIDCAPGEIRKDLIDCWGNFPKILIVHDTEPGAEYVYQMSEALGKFKYRCDLTIEGMPQTTAVSNVYDFKDWKGVYNDKFHFV